MFSCTVSQKPYFIYNSADADKVFINDSPLCSFKDTCIVNDIENFGNNVVQIRYIKKGHLDEYRVVSKYKRESSLKKFHHKLVTRNDLEKFVEITNYTNYCIKSKENYTFSKDSLIKSSEYFKNKNLAYTGLNQEKLSKCVVRGQQKSKLIEYNTSLRNKNFLDTSDNILKYSYLNKINLGYTEFPLLHFKVSTNKNANRYYSQNEIFNVFFTKIFWEVKDIYGNTLISFYDTIKSGEFINHKNETSEGFYYYELDGQIIFDEIKEKSISSLFSNEEFKKILLDQSEVIRELNFKKSTINKPKAFCKNILDAKKASVTIKSKNGHGSGFFINNNGYILTNYHVIADSINSKVISNNGKEFEYEIIQFSKIHDLALLKIDYNNEFTINLDTKKPNEAEDIYAIGSPSSTQLNQTISKGIISGFRKKNENSEVIQIDASINSGNSGGALIDKNFNAIGVISSKLYGYGKGFLSLYQ